MPAERKQGNRSMLRIWNRSRDALLAEQAVAAVSSAQRRTGLLKHTRLEPGQGLWIAPCEAVHTAGMKFAIDVLFLSRKKQILKIRTALPPWRIAACLRAHSVLELPAGTCRACRTEVGDQLEFESYTDTSP